MSVETRTLAVANELKELHSYITIKTKALDLLAQGNQTLVKLEMDLRTDPLLVDAWEDIKQKLMANKTLWSEIGRHWYLNVTRSVIPQHTFTHGGKRQSLGTKQQAIVKYAETLALAAPQTDDDDTVADKCVDEVDRRWRTSDPNGMSIVRRIVRTITRKVRRRSRTGDNEDQSDSEESIALFESLDKQIIEDVTSHNTTIPERWFDNSRALHHFNDGVLMGLIDLKKVEFQNQLESKRVELESKRVEMEPERLRAEAERLRAEAALLVTQQQRPTVATSSSTRKRHAPTPIDDHWLETQATPNWKGMVSLSVPFWEARPTDCALGIRDVYKKLTDYIGQTLTTSRVRYGLRPLAKTKDVLVYVKPEIPVAQHANALWEAMAGDSGHPSDTHAPDVERMQVSVPSAILPKIRHAPRFSNGARDLVAAVVGPLHLPTTALHSAAIERLDNEFVRKMKHWGVLWPPRSANPEVIPTFIDIERDPIVAQLTNWLRDTSTNTLPPVYPAIHATDNRIEEPIPPELQAMDADVWPHLQRAGLDRTCKFLRYYNNVSASTLGAQPLLPTLVPCSERLRQWKRISASAELSYKDMIDCFGWNDIERDAGVVQCITHALLLRQDVPLAMWYIKRNNKGNMWKWRVCLPMMRIACIYVSRMRRGGAPMENLSFTLRLGL
jgi:hypothetical protein